MCLAVHQRIKAGKADEQHQEDTHTAKERLRHLMHSGHHRIGMGNGEAQVVDVGQPTLAGGFGRVG